MPIWHGLGGFMSNSSSSSSLIKLLDSCRSFRINSYVFVASSLPAREGKKIASTGHLIVRHREVSVHWRATCNSLSAVASGRVELSMPFQSVQTPSLAMENFTINPPTTPCLDDDDELNINPPTPCQIGKRPPAPKPKRESAGHATTPCLRQAPASAQKPKKENQAGHSSERGGGSGFLKFR